MRYQIEWFDVCERLWGPDWIAPLSEVLHCNRRTVERWRSGKVLIPDDVEAMIVEMTPPPTLSRHLGDLIRRAAHGETEKQMRLDHEAQGMAILRLRDLRKTSRLVAQAVATHEAEALEAAKVEDE